MLFIITNSDGDTDIQSIDEGTFLEELRKGDYGDSPQFITADYLKSHSDPSYWPEGAILILQGRVIVPAVVTRASSWSLPK